MRIEFAMLIRVLVVGTELEGLYHDRRIMIIVIPIKAKKMTTHTTVVKGNKKLHGSISGLPRPASMR